MSRFLDTFPTVLYDIKKEKISNFEIVSDITFRFGIVKDILNNISSYYEYVIEDGDRPEILAEQVYDDPEAHWIILYANNMIDPLYDWPLNYRDFRNFIASKYGSTEWAQTNIHHYEKIIDQEDTTTGIIHTMKYIVGNTNLLTNVAPSIDIPDEIFYDELAEEADWDNHTVNGRMFRQRTYRRAVSYYDYENDLNNNKRNIKIIKKEYYKQIQQEFKTLTGFSRLGLRNLA